MRQALSLGMIRSAIRAVQFDLAAQIAHRQALMERLLRPADPDPERFAERLELEDQLHEWRATEAACLEEIRKRSATARKTVFGAGRMPIRGAGPDMLPVWPQAPCSGTQVFQVGCQA